MKAKERLNPATDFGAVFQSATALLIGFITLSLSLVGCATKRTVSEKDDGTKIRLSVGEVLVAKLPTDDLTNTNWRTQVIADPVLMPIGKISIKRRHYILPSHILDPPANEVWQFKAVKKGNQTLRFSFGVPVGTNPVPDWRALDFFQKLDVQYDVVVDK